MEAAMTRLRNLIAGALLALSSARASDYFELRIYDVATNKTGAVVERFRDTVEPLRRKHGIRTVAIWTNVATAAETLVYLLQARSREELQRQEKEFGNDPEFQKGYAASNAKHGKTVEKITSIPLLAESGAEMNFTAAPEGRTFDLRIYTIAPGKLVPFETRWRDRAVPIYGRHGLHIIGWWIAQEKDSDGNDRVVCLLAGPSLDTINKSIAEFHKDLEWQRVEAESERNGKLRLTVTSYKLLPIDFSQLR
jgi:hypothetical protein